MRKWVCGLGCAAVLSALVGSNLLADVEAPLKSAKPTADNDKNDEKPASVGKEAGTKAATAKVEKGPFKVAVTVKGILEAGDMTEVVLSPEAFTPDVRGLLTVVKAVEQGARVRQGDPLITLDFDRIDQMIKDVESDRRLSELSIKLAEEELPVLERLLPIELAAAERSKRIADEDLKYFHEVDRPLTEKAVNHSVKMSAQWLEYAKEELHQLEKMYRSKDLTEETEEIILKRQRHQVENAAFYLETSRIRRDEVLKIELPRKEVTLNENATRQGLLHEKARTTLPLQVSQKRLTLAKAKYERAKAEDRLGKLKKDRAMMAVKSPADGIVYYGKCLRGQWTTAGTIASKLQKGGVIMPDEVVLTIVKPRPLFVRATVEEKDVHLLRPEAKGKAVMVPYPDTKLPIRVESVSAIPVTPGNFEARIALELGDDDQVLMPGMACTVKVVPYLKKDALTVPATAVFTDDLDEDEHYVYLAGKGSRAEKRSVKVGKTSGGKTEILGGVNEGDEILLEKPKADQGGGS
jgi:HlyD family secretion protein